MPVDSSAPVSHRTIRAFCWIALGTSVVVVSALFAAIWRHPMPYAFETSAFRHLTGLNTSRDIRGARLFGGAQAFTLTLAIVLLFGAAVRRTRAAMVITLGASLTLAFNDMVLQALVHREGIGATATFARLDYFPSGHVTAAAAAGLAVVALLALIEAPWPVVIVALACVASMTVSVGWASVYRRDHLVLDVVAAVFVAAAGVGTATLLALRDDGPAHYRRSPA